MRQLLLLLSSVVLVSVGCDDSSDSPRCYLSSDCGSGQLCVLFESEARVCVDRCDTSISSLCEDGRACVSTSAEDARSDVCLPGGAVAEGQECSTSVECQLGAICLLASGQSTSTCQRLCDVGGAATCGTGWTCTAIEPLTSTTRGTCVQEAPP